MPGEFWATIGVMDGAALHVIFDIAAWLAVLVFGAGLGAYLFGTLNLWLSEAPGIARSVEGTLAGGIVGIELYK